MRNQLESLGLDPEVIARRRRVAEGLARMFLAEAHESVDPGDRQLRLLAAATNLRIAGADAILLDEPQRAKTAFGDASEAYLQAGSEFGWMLARLGENSKSRRVRGDQFERPGGGVYRLWSDEFFSPGSRGAADDLRHLLADLGNRPGARWGMLGLSSKSHVELHQACVEWDSRRSSPRLRDALMPLLGAYSAAIERLQLNRFHWQRLVAPLHPAEPEVMAVVVSVNTLLIGRGTSLEDELEYLPMGQSARTIVTGFLAHYHTRGMERGEGELT